MHTIEQMQNTLKDVFAAPAPPPVEFCTEHRNEAWTDESFVASQATGARAQARFKDATNPAMKVQVSYSNEGWYLSFPCTMVPDEDGNFHAVTLNKNGKSWCAASDEMYLQGRIKPLGEQKCGNCEENHKLFVFIPDEDATAEFYFYSADQLETYLAAMGVKADDKESMEF